MSHFSVDMVAHRHGQDIWAQGEQVWAHAKGMMNPKKHNVHNICFERMEHLLRTSKEGKYGHSWTQV